MDNTIADTRRLFTKPQNLNDAYGPPSNFLEIDVCNPETVGVGRNRYTTYEVKLKVSWGLLALACRLTSEPKAGKEVVPPSHAECWHHRQAGEIPIWLCERV